MGLYFRKSVSFGPLRLNLSKGGIGTSIGPKGARLGVDARGRAYVHCGRGGIYYRSGLGGSGIGVPAARSDTTVSKHRTIESADVSDMVPASAEGMLAELNRCQAVYPAFIPFALVSAVVAAIAFAYAPVWLGACVLVAATIGTVGLVIMFNHRRTFTLNYAIEGEYAEQYRETLEAFDRLCSAGRVWTVHSESNVLNQKYHAGAGTSLRRSVVRPVIALPRRVRSNVTPPQLRAGRQTLFFLPDRLLVFDGRKVGAVEYSDMTIETKMIRFIETDRPPADAQQVDTTWQYTNKSGGPDRRFSANRQLPVMQYGEITLKSGSGLCERFHVSSTFVAEWFASALRQLSAGLKSESRGDAFALR